MWCHPGDRAGNAWLIKGGFDYFKLTNDLYGSLICDYLLDWTLEVIETELRSRQKHLGSSDLLWNFVGDDVTVHIPPSFLQEQEVEQLLWEVCQAIEKSSHRRYRVAALPLPAGFFDDIPRASLKAIRTSRTCNEGFLQPPSISSAACCIRMGGEEMPAAYDRRSMYERMSLACQSALRTCKLQRKRVPIQKDEPGTLDTEPAYQPVLFHFNPVYYSNSELYAPARVGILPGSRNIAAMSLGSVWRESTPYSARTRPTACPGN